MSGSSSRRRFLASVGRGTLLTALGPVFASEMGILSPVFAEEPEGRLTFGALESLVSELQQTPAEQVQSLILQRYREGTSLRTLTGAGALANARTFGGEDYIGFHTFMAFAPALNMSRRLPSDAAPLPVLKVLYRNSARIQESGGSASEVLHALSGSPVADGDDQKLRQAVMGHEVAQSEQILSSLAARDPRAALQALLPLVQDNPEVHRTVLPFRAWAMLDIVGEEHALTLLRQSLRYCLQSESYRRAEWDEHAALLTRLMDEFRLHRWTPGTAIADDDQIRHLSEQFATASPNDAARAAAETLAAGYAPSQVGEALSLAASLLVLRDGGRLPQWETPLKPAGCVHGDSVGVHASDAANAWRNLADVTTGSSALSCLLIGAWQVARDRMSGGHLLEQPLPTARLLNEVAATDADQLLAQLDEAIRFNQQAHATAIAQKYGMLGLAPDPIFATLLKYAVSEDGALHAEKYFQTVSDDFQSTRPSLRWQHVAALARVTASEYGRPAEGQAQARDLLGLKS
ncbi:MAG: hypothetical protein KDA96_19785 [Planctomycetaceae bacterium]|nr:hypothetical protein [Planctomycetaceae bacterium]